MMHLDQLLMSDEEIPQFQCDACGRRFYWKPKLAGRQFRCACGEMVQCPQNESEAKLTYDLAPEPEPPSVPVAQLAPSESTIQYATPSTPPAESKEQLMINYYGPLALLCGGVVVEILTSLLRYHSLVMAANFVGLQLLGGVISMLIVLLLAVKFRGILLGPIWITVLKLAAISIGPPAAVDLVAPFLNLCGLGVVLGYIAEFMLFFAFLRAFFELNESDTWYCVAILFVINVGFSILLRFF